MSRLIAHCKSPPTFLLERKPVTSWFARIECKVRIALRQNRATPSKVDELTREANPSGLCAFGQSPVPQGRSLADAKKRRHRRRDRGHAGDATTIDHTTYLALLNSLHICTVENEAPWQPARQRLN